MENQQETKPSLYWKSLDQKYQTPEFLEQFEKEFESSPLKEADEKSGLARRQFMKLMGASIALSTAACVRRPVQTIIPYNKRPAEVSLGIPNYYASSFHDGREGFAVNVKTREGRPLFLRGNPTYPGNGQGLSVRGTSQILSLYDPDRLRTPILNSQNPDKRGNMMTIPRDWDSIDKKVVEQLAKGNVRFLTADIASPTLGAMFNSFVQSVGGKVHTWKPINHSEILQAAKACYGVAAVPKLRYDKAMYIVSVDGDFLGTHLNPTESSLLFGMARDPEKAMSKLVSFQSVPSLTSFNSDDNYLIKPSQQLPLVLAMIHELGFVQKKVSVPESFKAVTEPHAKIYESLKMSHEDFAKVVGDLWKHAGASLVVAGGLPTKTADALSLQIAVNYLNSLLGNDGNTVHWSNGLKAFGGEDQQLESLITAMKNGEVKTLFINELNPIYNLPASLGFKEALSKVESVIVTNNWMDETAVHADILAPAGHAMENWGDNEFSPGLFSIQQPTIRPLHNTRSLGDSMMAWSKLMNKPLTSEESFYTYLKVSWMKKLGTEKAWFDFLQTGYKGEGFSGTERTMGFNTSALSGVTVKAVSSPIELAIYEKVQMHDGTLANVSWIQELPDPVTKITWDNYLMVSPVLAKEKGLRDGSMVEVKTPHHTMKLPVYVSPGQHAGVVAVATGYGRTQGGELLKNVGFNVNDFIQALDGRLLWSGFPVEIKDTHEEIYRLAQTQGHHTMHGRQLAVETTESHYKKDGDIGMHRHKIFSIWNKQSNDGHRWAMGIDLNACTGCSACMLACQSENNIPTVGKKYILSGREMHWIRIDRYFSGNENEACDAIFQPVTCQHCENAPCETVCPVLATVHSDEGLNDMVYNRCVGTRYCSNNCPYKVRRFNWFFYDGHYKREPLEMALNPSVTVRTRGVMEKCTFCVQRIKEATNTAKDEKRPLKDGEIQTACQSVCPSKCITFGDINDKDSEVSQWFANKRNYSLLEELNTVPRLRYLAKIRNTQRSIGGHHDAHDEPPHGSGEAPAHKEEGHS